MSQWRGNDIRNGDVQERVRWKEEIGDKGEDGVMRERVRWGRHPAYAV